MPEESQVESCEHQDDANIHCQPFPESVSEEREIHSDYHGCHCHHVKRDSDLPAHFSSHGLYRKGRGECPEGKPCFGWVCDQPMAQVGPCSPSPPSAFGKRAETV